MTNDRTALLDDPQVRLFLPLLYMAWADFDLSADEVRALSGYFDTLPWLRHRAREAIRVWLDPARPPSAADLRALLTSIERAAPTLKLDERRSLVELGLALSETAPGSEAEAALRTIEGILGVEGLGSAGFALPQAPVDGDGRASGSSDREPVRALGRVLDGKYVDARQKARAFLEAPEHRYAYGLPSESHRDLVFGWLKELAAEGFGALGYPGVTSDERDLGAFMATFETLGFGDLSLLVKFGVQFGLFGGSIFFLGNEEHRQKWLPKVASLEVPGCFAMSEVGHGSNVSELETRARFDPTSGEFEIHTPSESARKEWIGGAARDARMATVFAQLEIDGVGYGVHAFLVPIRDERGELLPGVRAGDCGHKMGLNGVDNGRLWFDHVRVPKEALLDRFAQVHPDGSYVSEIASTSKRFFTMLGTLVAGRVSVASASVSAAKVGLAVAIRYGDKRRQFGQPGQAETPILDYLAHQRRLLPALARAYAGHFAIDRLRERYLGRTEDDSREVEALAAALKAQLTWDAVQTLQHCRECCGGQGYLSQNRLASLRADTDVFTTFEGDNTVLMQLVAKSLLTDFRKQFSESRLVAFARLLARRAVTGVIEKNAIAARTTDGEHLRSVDFQLAALRYREQKLLETAASRLSSRIRAGTSAEESINEVQDHLLSLSEAYAERVIYESFVAKAEGLAAGRLTEALDRLRSLYGLVTLERSGAFYLADGYFEAPKSKAVRAEINRLCSELRPDALDLVDAFGIPEQCLAAPIAFFDPAHPAWSESHS